MVSTVGVKNERPELVFVYGTLKSGHFNYDAYLSKALEAKQAAFIGCGKTEAELLLVVQHERNIPFLYFLPPSSTLLRGQKVLGEVYAVSRPCLKGLDLLEDTASGFYEKKKNKCELR
jgi:gamma-glutamylcyclotransferase (GGCT)/AIG2-like uncharacterized protein YtfP